MIDVPGVPTSGTGDQAGGCLRKFLGDAMMMKAVVAVGTGTGVATGRPIDALRSYYKCCNVGVVQSAESAIMGVREGPR